jgi:hypothetical protein
MSKTVSGSTLPVIETDGQGGHVPYGREDQSRVNLTTPVPGGGDGAVAAMHTREDRVALLLEENNHLLRELIALVGAMVSV